MEALVGDCEHFGICEHFTRVDVCMEALVGIVNILAFVNMFY